MRLTPLLELESALKPYIAHLRRRGDQPGAERAERMLAEVHAEAIKLERASEEFEWVMENV